MRDPANKPFYEGTIEQTFGKTVEQQQKDVDTPRRELRGIQHEIELRVNAELRS